MQFWHCKTKRIRYVNSNIDEITQPFPKAGKQETLWGCEIRVEVLGRKWSLKYDIA